MKKMIKGLFAVSSLLLAVSCADYNETNNFTADSDPSVVIPYRDLAPVKSYIDRNTYPNMTLGVQLKVADFNKQELAHAAAVTNFDNVAFGSTLMSGTIVNENGVMNFLSMKDLLDHVQEIGGEVFGSPIVANANQADKWLSTLTAPIEIKVEPVADKFVDYTTMEQWTGKADRGKPTIVKNFDGNDNALKVPKRSEVYIVDGFDIDLKGNYTITLYAQAESDDNVIFTFSGKTLQEGGKDKKFAIKAGKWTKVVIETTPAEDATEGYLLMEGNKNSIIYVKSVEVVHYPDSHRPQTEQEVNDTIHYALNTWCDNLMKYNEGRITSFDLIDEAIDSKTTLDNGMYDLKHAGKDQIFWQDIFGSEQYAPVVSAVAKDAFVKHGGNAADLKFFISESDLEDSKKFESLEYWMDIWDANGAQIDGINAKLNLTYSEDAATQAANEASLQTLLENLKETGKLIRLSNFDIVYKDAEGNKVTTDQITDAQRQLLADYYAHVIKAYMNTIPNEKQAGICKLNMVDTTNDPVGLWSLNDKKDWVRNATYEAFCKALAGKVN